MVTFDSVIIAADGQSFPRTANDIVNCLQVKFGVVGGQLLRASKSMLADQDVVEGGASYSLVNYSRVSKNKRKQST